MASFGKSFLHCFSPGGISIVFSLPDTTLYTTELGCLINSGYLFRKDGVCLYIIWTLCWLGIFGSSKKPVFSLTGTLNSDYNRFQLTVAENRF